MPEVPEIDGEPLSYVVRIMELKESEWPVLETVEPPDGTQFWSTSGGTVFRREPPSAAARARADEIIAAHDRWHAKHWRFPREVRSLEREADRASKQKDKLRAKIDRTRVYLHRACHQGTGSRDRGRGRQAVRRHHARVDPARPAQAQSGGVAIKFPKGEGLLKDRGRNSDYEKNPRLVMAGAAANPVGGWRGSESTDLNNARSGPPFQSLGEKKAPWASRAWGLRPRAVTHVGPRERQHGTIWVSDQGAARSQEASTKRCVSNVDKGKPPHRHNQKGLSAPSPFPFGGEHNARSDSLSRLELATSPRRGCMLPYIYRTFI
jgi:hypothetical protein